MLLPKYGMCYSGTTYCGEGIGFDLLLSTSVQKANFAPFTPGLKAGAPSTPIRAETALRGPTFLCNR